MRVACTECTYTSMHACACACVSDKKESDHVQHVRVFGSNPFSMYNNLAVYSHRQVALWFLADLRRWPYLLAFRTSCSHRMLVLTARNDGASMAEEGCGMVVDRGECTDVSSYLLTMTTFGGLQASLRRLSSPRLPPSLFRAAQNAASVG